MPPRDFDLDIQAIRRGLERDGWQLHTSRGNHDVYRHPDHPNHVPVPRGRGDLPIGTARAIARGAGWVR